MLIDIESSSDDSDFVNPPPKRNRCLEKEVYNIPQQPTRQAVTHTDGEAAANKMWKVLLLLSTVDVTTICRNMEIGKYTFMLM
jgi:hypothetical protein